MQTAILLALIQVAGPTQFKQVYQKSINGYSVSVSAGEGLKESEARVAVRERGSKKSQLLARIVDRGQVGYGVLRADDSTMVIEQMGFYGPEGRLKLFYDLPAKTLLKQINYPYRTGLAAVDDGEIVGATGAPPSVIQQLKQRPVEPRLGEDDLSHLPKELQDHPMPQPTYAEFARARPDRVGDGYRQSSTNLEEKPGPFQVMGSRIWFGRVFYDGEGTTGIGGFGYFDTSTSTYTFLPVPTLVGWSVSALLIEGDVAWIGLASQPEGEVYSGGLLRHDLKTGATREFPVEEVIAQIVRWEDHLYLATKTGGYHIRGDRLIERYRVEPSRDGRFIILTESVSPAR